MDDRSTVYLNHAGTSWPKPPPVVDAAAAASISDPATWPELFSNAHQTVADFFHVDSERLLLTPSCTAALQLGVLDHPWKPGDRVLTSRFEHHALQRSLEKLADWGVEIVQLPPTDSDLIDLSALEAELQAGRVRLVAITAACNVTGQLLPYAEVIELAHRYQALALIDGAQIAGWWDLDIADLGVDLFTFAGHKGPQAPWGVGGLYVAPHVAMHTPWATCAATAAEGSPPRCASMPGYCDAGSVNLVALAGLAAGCQWLSEAAQRNRLEQARQLADSFAVAVRPLPGVTLHHDVPAADKMPTVAISVADSPAANEAARLSRLGVITSGGFQCAAQAHQALGTAESGVLRFSFGPLSDRDDVVRAIQLVTRNVTS